MRFEIRISCSTTEDMEFLKAVMDEVTKKFEAKI